MRKQTIKFNEFVSGEYKVKEKSRKQRIVRNTLRVGSSAILPLVTGGAVGTLGLVLTTGQVLACGTSTTGTQAVTVGASAVVGETATRTLAHALDPLIDILVAISLPVASVVMVGGCFFFMLGNSEKAWSMIQNAGLGYVLIQLSPLFIKMLEQVGKAM
ncbi:hypothetical protein ACIFOT_29785 [Neobacillus sp. NRS-1170]|uniref:hypothetical protein n=1 Tax=Neobacillus sp. NRS-1170 TaxID=3233898 RepID=UPI003D28E815